jgi:hypothetical protein
MLTVPAEEVKITRLTVPASLHALMMLSIPSTVGLITSFCRGVSDISLCPVTDSKFCFSWHGSAYLRVLGVEVHGRGNVEDAGAARDGLVEAAFLAQVGSPDGQPLLGSRKLQQWLRLLHVP